MFTLSDQPIDARALHAHLSDATAGACVTFEGWVRNHHEGRDVAALTYEAYPELALTEGNAILQETLAKFAITHAKAVHRIGPLQISEMAVWVGVSAAHRGPAFDACRHLIDEIKARVPIWKRELFSDGTALWVNSEPIR